MDPDAPHLVLPGQRAAAMACLIPGIAILASACAAPPIRFSEARARAHVNMLAGVIGSRPTGTEANRRAREYLVDELRRSGFEVRLQETDAVRPEHGQTAHVVNIIARKAGARPDAIALIAHYDSPPESPGAADDGLGAAVCLEAGRVLVARPRPTCSLVIVLTDGEELGLMGAAALVQDPVITQIRAYLNFEAVGSSGPSLLFEAGPGSPWLARIWARRAPEPAGGSYVTEIYKRLPNDTDFSILKRTGIPGLNLAPAGDSYAYHTPRDTPERLASETVRQTGANTVAIVEALDRIDMTDRSGGQARYFDVMRWRAVAFGPSAGLALAVTAMLAGLLSWIRLLVIGCRTTGLRQIVVAGIWAVLALIVTAASFLGSAWALRAAREVYHPWYAHPDRLFVLMALAGVLGVRFVRRVRRVLPHWAHGTGDPAAVWTLVLPVWIALAAAAQWMAPAASYLATVPLLAAAVVLVIVRVRSRVPVGAASALIFVVAGILWIRLGVDLLHFAVPAFGRFPIVTPLFAYPALMLVLSLYLAPPILALGAGRRHRRWVRRLVDGIFLIALAITGVLAYGASAYTEARPLRRVARYIEDVVLQRAYFEVAGNEPGLDLAGVVPDTENWQLGRDQAPVGFPVGPPPGAFGFRTRTTVMAAPPASVQSVVRPEEGTATLEISVFPRAPGLAVRFALPPGVIPIDANLAGRVRNGRWLAACIAPPPEGIVFKARVRADQAASLGSTQVIVTDAGLPGGDGWQRLPPWLPQDRAVWTARSIFILPAFTK